jgi:phospholipid/cholesterol/gamma-HCH transport system substrate-binding protein
LARGRALLPAAGRLVDAAAPVAAQLPAAAGELADATTAARPALRSARAAVAAAPAGLRALARLLRGAAPVLEQLVPALRRSGPMLDQLRVRLPDAFSFFANWADFTANYDANGHGARVGIVLPPTSTKALAPSADGAGQLRPPYLRTPGSLEGEPWTDYAKSFVAGGKAAGDGR